MSCNLIWNKGIVLFCMFAVLHSSTLNAQTDDDNHRKYWYYKSRLNNDFLKVGLGPGESIPGGTRGLWISKFVDPNNTSISSNNELTWGDATSGLGYYIAILATEYKLLSINNQSTTKVKHELFCALNAVNRLDFVAETVFNGQPSLNGYFIRDDVPANFISQNYSHFNYFVNGGSISNNRVSMGFMSDFDSGVNAIRSGFLSWSTFTSTHGGVAATSSTAPLIEMNQDQSIALLYGLAFVTKFVPAFETDGASVFGFGSGETSLTTEAQNIADRIIKHIKDSKNLSGTSCVSFGTGWGIKNPVTCDPVGINNTSGNDGPGVGDDAQVFAYPLAEGGCVIKTGTFGGIQNAPLTWGAPKQCSGNNDYHNFYSSNIAYATWDGMANVPLPGNGDNRLHVANLSAICNCVYGTIGDKFVQELTTAWMNVPVLNWFGIIVSYAYSLVSSIVTTFTPGKYYNNTSTSININSYVGNSDFDHAPLSRRVLHGGFYQQNLDYSFLYLLNVAPCDNIYNIPTENVPFKHVEWSGSDRIEHPLQRQGIPGSDPLDLVAKGEFNGLDYLLYHNLWYIHQSQPGLHFGTMPHISDLSDIYVNKSGGNFNANLNAYETITCEDTKPNYTNNSFWRAGKIIDLKPGTEFTGTNNVHLYIEHFTCATNQGQFKTSQIDSTEQDIKDDGIPYHHIDYPKEPVVPTTTINNTDTHFENKIKLNNTKTKRVDGGITTANSKEFYVKPSVTKDAIRAYFEIEKNEKAFISILDLGGKVVYSNTNLSNNDSGLIINLNELANGIYILKYTTTNGTSKTQKIIKE